MRATSGRRCGGTIQNSPRATLGPLAEKIKQQHDGRRNRAHHGGEAIAGDKRDLIALPQPVAHWLERPADDLVGVQGRPEQFDRLFSDKLAGKVVQHSLQIDGDGARFDQQALCGDGDNQDADAEQNKEQADGEQQARPARPPGRPINERREDISDDGRQHERQQNQLDEIKKE